MADAISGAAVGSLIAALGEKVATACPMLAARLSIEFLRPLPMQALQAQTRIVREGRKQQVLSIVLSAGGKECVNATLVRLRTEGGGSQTGPGEAFEPPTGRPFHPLVGSGSPVLGWVDSRVQRSNDSGPGVSEAWLRYRGTILEGEPLTPLTRTALFADFGNGLAPVVDPAKFTYMNADLSVHLARLPMGEWLRLRVRTLNGDNALAMVGMEIGDSQGFIGWAHQALLLEPRSP